MRIVTKGTLRKWAKQHAAQASALRSWEATVSKADWKTWDDVRKTYRKADRVLLSKGNEITIFNVGDGFRLLAFIKYLPGKNESIVYTKEYLTHKEYETGGWKKRLDHD